jgi:hypothetical protein
METSVKEKPDKFPDDQSCYVRPAGFGDYFDCLGKWALMCPYALSMGEGHLCRHPKASGIKQLSDCDTIVK